jgi:CRP-like cAMP-binding protein
MEAIKKVLADHPFFKGLAPEYVEMLASVATNIQFEAKDFLFRDGEESDQFYVILRGRVALETFAPERGPIIVSTLGEGEVLGWTWIVEPYIHRYDAQALELTRVLALDGKSLRRKCEENHDLGYELMKRFTHIMAQRLEATRLQLIDVYGTPLPRRKS